jgi:hypothetical protein
MKTSDEQQTSGTDRQTNHSWLLATERDSTLTNAEQDLDYSMAIVVDSIEIDFVLVDSSVDALEPMTYPTMMNYRTERVSVAWRKSAKQSYLKNG